MNSNFMRRTALLFCMASSAMAAEVSLEGEGKLTGELAGMDADGTIKLISPISKTPLLINGDKTVRVDFGSPSSPAEISSQRVELTNGDMLPVKVLSLADGLLNVESGDLGQLAISHDMVSTIQLGIFPKRVIYSGSDDFKGWTRDSDGTKNWTIDGEEFVAEGLGTLSRDAELPEKFIISFSLEWDNYPNFQFRFAEPTEERSGRADRYMLQFVGSGLAVFRESTSKSGNVPILSINRTTQRQKDNRMQIEIRVDRTRGNLHLYIDGQLEGRYTDPVRGVPTGKGISFISRAPRESRQRVGDIMVLEWDDSGDRHRSEDRGDGKSDSLIGRNGERHGGKLTGIRMDGDMSVYLFKSDFQKEVMALPEQEISTIFLGGGDAVAGKGDSGAFILNLRGGGQMRVSSCVFDAGKVTAQHPLLGKIEIDRKGIISLERSKAPKAKPEQ